MQTDPNWSNFLWNEKAQQVSRSIFLNEDLPFLLKEIIREKNLDMIWSMERDLRGCNVLG
jgi:hypothetical protein